MLHRRDSTGSTGSNGEGISLLRIGSITLPSSMDLRQYLEQMQASSPCSQIYLHKPQLALGGRSRPLVICHPLLPMSIGQAQCKKHS